MDTLATLRERAGLKVKDLAALLNETYSDVYAAEKNEGQELRRYKAKYEALHHKMRVFLEHAAQDEQRKIMSAKLRRTVGDDEDSEKLVEEAAARMARIWAQAPPGWQHEVEWNGHRSGDLVHVRDAEGTYTFLCLVTTTTGSQHVDCYGGAAGVMHHRSFAPDRILG
jgi:hypothetical protein